jgi:glycosyltransferase involved in cell wall biosynthesis
VTDSHADLVIVPTFNERESIATAVHRLFDACPDGVELLVVDDRSPDATADVVKDLAGENDRIHLIERARKLGLGSAYVAGFRWAIDRGYRAVVEMDADLSHDPADVPRLLAGLADADLVIGSRYVQGGGVGNWGRARRILSQAGNLYARAWLGFDVRDSTSGFRAYRVAALTEQDLAGVRSEGYAFQIEMVRRFYRAGKHIAEVPITFVERGAGRSKMSRGIVFEAIGRVTEWGLRDRLLRRG